MLFKYANDGLFNSIHVNLQTFLRQKSDYCQVQKSYVRFAVSNVFTEDFFPSFRKDIQTHIINK